jgi:hypothetical protein
MLTSTHDLVDTVHALLGIEVNHLHHLGKPQDGVQRRSELMTHQGEEVGLGLVGCVSAEQAVVLNGNGREVGETFDELHRRLVRDPHIRGVDGERTQHLPPSATIGVDQHERSPCVAATSRNWTQLWSVFTSLAMTGRPVNAAVPHDP